MGDLVYLKMAPYRLAAFGFRGALKLQNKYYGPFLITQRIGNSAYKLQFPSNCRYTRSFMSASSRNILDKRRFQAPIFQWSMQMARLKRARPQFYKSGKFHATMHQWFNGKSSGKICHQRTRRGRMQTSSNTHFQRFSSKRLKLGVQHKNRREDSSMLKKGAMSGPELQ